MIRTPPETYDQAVFQEILQQIQQLLDEKHSRMSDLEAGLTRVVVTSPNGTRYALTVSDAGVVGSTAL